jgi:beta-ribofuranosylaminobenzene 5'-phosphate synthase
MSALEQLPTRITVEAPARLHFGVLDLRGHLGRRFGGIGAAIPVPAVRLEVTRNESITAEGPDAGRALEFARRFLASYQLKGGAHLCVAQTIPPHVGLGSGTQLALAVGRALAELHGIQVEPPALARAVGRGVRSAIGTWVFALGGFVLEGGQRPGSDGLAPLISRLPMPSVWQAVIAIPQGTPGLSGETEAEAFAKLPPPSEHEVERVAHLVLMQLLPALAEADLAGFGAALSEVQQITGTWFSGAQGGSFAAGASAQLVRLLAEFGAQGVGQSSWGPTVYGLTPDADSARDLASRVQARLGDSGVVYQTGFAQRGALVHTEWTAVGRD